MSARLVESAGRHFELYQHSTHLLAFAWSAVITLLIQTRHQLDIESIEELLLRRVVIWPNVLLECSAYACRVLLCHACAIAALSSNWRKFDLANQ